MLVEDMNRVLLAASSGDLEQRVATPDNPTSYAARRAQGLNHLLDIVDAFVRESGDTLEATSEGRYHRRFLTRGMPGSFAVGAKRIDDAHKVMEATALKLAAEEAQQAEMGARALDISGQVAAASTELSASADALAESMALAVSGTDKASDQVGTLADANASIVETVREIAKIAAQTRILAMNATIEAARAGEAGKGFAVVAEEVKTLADETSESLAAITAQVENVSAASAAMAQAISGVTTVIKDVNMQAQGIADAAGGEGGLSYLAETLSQDLGKRAALAG